MTSSERTILFRKNRKKLLVDYCGGKCQLCGYDKIQNALTFHHIDPNLKQYGISENGVCHNIDKDITEVKKTILLCANCHAEVHAGLYSKKQLQNKQFFNEEVIKKYKQEKEKKVYYCKDCGTEVSKYANRCVKCQALHQRKVKRPDRKQLKELIRKYPFVTIGKKYDVSDNTIRKWCKKENLPYRKKDIQNYSEEQWIKL